MKLTIIRIEENIVTCELEGGSQIEIAKIWFDEGVKVNDSIEFQSIFDKINSADF